MQNRVMFADDGYVYFASRMKAAADATADLPNSASSSSLLRVAGCPADIGQAGGLAGADGALDNNDFIAFIGFFFNADARADRGVAGGLPGADGQFDNNDFIAFINQFFAGC
jgi:putative intracellular protease/amidase